MPEPSTTIFVEGSFKELIVEYSQYVDALNKTHGNTESDLVSLVSKYIESDQEKLMTLVVDASSHLCSAPEKEFISSYNLLIYLIVETASYHLFPKICQNLYASLASSSVHNSASALFVLATIFNILPAHYITRYYVFLIILDAADKTGTYDTLRPQLKLLPTWITTWKLDPEQERQLYLSLHKLAQTAANVEDAHKYLIAALRTFPPKETSSSQARSISLLCLRAALSNPNQFDFQDLTTLDSIQELNSSDPTHYELLEIFVGATLDDFYEFVAANPTWLEANGFDVTVLTKKMRLLTLASLAAGSSGPSRILSYASIATALDIPEADVEMWVIDVIRAGLVEGKLSQLKKTFLIHRATYRVFGEKQWREVAARLDLWRNSLTNVLKVITTEKENVAVMRDNSNRPSTNMNNYSNVNNFLSGSNANKKPLRP